MTPYRLKKLSKYNQQGQKFGDDTGRHRRPYPKSLIYKEFLQPTVGDL